MTIYLHISCMHVIRLPPCLFYLNLGANHAIYLVIAAISHQQQMSLDNTSLALCHFVWWKWLLCKVVASWKKLKLLRTITMQLFCRSNFICNQVCNHCVLCTVLSFFVSWFPILKFLKTKQIIIKILKKKEIKPNFEEKNQIFKKSLYFFKIGSIFFQNVQKMLPPKFVIFLWNLPFYFTKYIYEFVKLSAK